METNISKKSEKVNSFSDAPKNLKAVPPKQPSLVFDRCNACNTEIPKGTKLCHVCKVDPKIVYSEGLFSREFRAKYSKEFLFDGSQGWHMLQKNGHWIPSEDVPRICVQDLIQTLLPEKSYGNSESEEGKKAERAIKSLWRSFDTNKVKNSALSMAKDYLTIKTDRWDADPAIIGTPEGIVDLVSGRNHDCEPNFYVTKSLKCDPDFESEPTQWLAFLNEVCSEDQKLIDYLQLVLGVCLTGYCQDEKLYLIHGMPSTGKTTFLEVIKHIFADYARAVSIENLVGDRQDHLEWLASTAGKRLIISSEPKRNQQWRSSILNDFISGATMSARFMHRNSFDFVPKAKIIITANHRPRITSPEDGLTRKIDIIGFNVRIPEHRQDSSLKCKLLKEAPAILAWIVKGAKEYIDKYHSQGRKIETPESVKLSTKEYLEEEDVVGQFIADCFVIEYEEKLPMIEIYRKYQIWADANGIRKPSQLSNRGLARTLTAKGFPADEKTTKYKGKTERVRNGLRLKGLNE